MYRQMALSAPQPSLRDIPMAFVGNECRKTSGHVWFECVAVRQAISYSISQPMKGEVMTKKIAESVNRREFLKGSIGAAVAAGCLTNPGLREALAQASAAGKP